MPSARAESPTELPLLRRDVDALSQRMFLEVSGRRAALLGNELGQFECWIWPIKVCHDLDIAIDGDRGAKLARSVEVQPHLTRIEYAASDIRVRQTMFAALDRRAIVFLFEVECERTFELELRFTPDFRPMWPAGFGGQIALRDDDSGAFALTEELGRFAAFFGSPEAEPVRTDADHALPRDPISIRMCITPARAKLGPIPFFITGGETMPAPLSASALVGEQGAAMGHSRAHAVLALARDEYRRIVGDWRDVLAQFEAHWRDFLGRTTHFESDDARHTEAFLWAKIAIEKAWVEIDGLGRGLVAGLGPSGSGERPGFGWFFDGDAMEASRAMTAYGDFEGARRVLEFAASHQRADGKMMHELVLSARLCNWIEDYPYAYYKAGNTPDFIAAVDQYVQASGDVELCDRMWPHVKRAYEHCIACIDDEGYLSNLKAGICAVEAGSLVGKVRADIFLHGLWMSALRGVQSLATKCGDKALADDAQRRTDAAQGLLETFWSHERGRFGFAHLVNGARCDDMTAYQAFPLAHGFGTEERSLATAAALNHPTLASDWGVRFFATDSSIYDASNYNTGSVFPYANNFAILALFRQGLASAANQLLASQIALQSFSGLGYVPEHLVGDRCEAPGRGVPHQIFSSTCIVQSTLFGVLGLAAPLSGASSLSLALPPACDRLQVSNVRLGASVADIEIARERAANRTILVVAYEIVGRESSEILLQLSVPPLSRHASLSSRSKPDAFEVRLSLHGASLQASVFPIKFGGRYAWIIKYDSGPELLLDHSPAPRGATSSKLRVCEVVHDEKSVAWTLWGLAGQTYTIGWRSDRKVEFSGAKTLGNKLEIVFPAGTTEFTSTKLRAVALD
jgi:hypothetical protein